VLTLQNPTLSLISLYQAQGHLPSARILEEQRTALAGAWERVANLKILLSSKSKEPAAPSDSSSVQHTAEPQKWEDFEFRFLNDFTVQVRSPQFDEVVNYEILGFADGRCKSAKNKRSKPTQPWNVLYRFAEGRGTIARSKNDGESWRQVETSVYSIGRKLQTYFGVEASPINYVPRHGYQTKFRIYLASGSLG